MPRKPDLFSIVVNEICTKQNGIQLKVGDDTTLKDMFLRQGGNIDQLIDGVLPEFDRLKQVILQAFNAQKIAANMDNRYRVASIRINVKDLQNQLDLGRNVALEIAEASLGKEILAALLKVKK